MASIRKERRPEAPSYTYGVNRENQEFPAIVLSGRVFFGISTVQMHWLASTAAKLHVQHFYEN